MWIILRLLFYYLLGGVTFIPLLLGLGLFWLKKQAEDEKIRIALEEKENTLNRTAEQLKTDPNPITATQDDIATERRPPLLASQAMNANLAERIPAGNRFLKPMELSVQMRRHFAPSKRSSKVTVAEDVVEGRGFEETHSDATKGPIGDEKQINEDLAKSSGTSTPLTSTSTSAATATSAAAAGQGRPPKEGMWSKWTQLRQNVLRSGSTATPSTTGVSTHVQLQGAILYMWDTKAKQNSLGVINLEFCEVDIVSPETVLNISGTPKLKDGELFSKRNALRIQPLSAKKTNAADSSSLSGLSLPENLQTSENGNKAGVHGMAAVYPDMDNGEVKSDNQSTASTTTGVENELPKTESEEQRNMRARLRKREIAESQPWYFSFKSNSEFEDWYHALLLRSSTPTYVPSKPVPSIKSIFPDESMQGLIDTLNSQSDPLPIRWLNALIGRLWFSIYGTKTIQEFVTTKLQRKLDRSPLSNFGVDTGLEVLKVDIGSTPPFFSKPMLKETSPDGTVSFAIKIHFRGKVTIKIGAFNETLVLAATVSSLEGNVIVKVKPAPSNRIWYSFTEKPEIDLNIEPYIYASSRGIGMFTNIIREQLVKAFHEALVLPNWDDVPFFDTSDLPIRGGIFDDESKDEAERLPELEGEDLLLGVHLTTPPENSSATLDALDLPSVTRETATMGTEPSTVPGRSHGEDSTVKTVKGHSRKKSSLSHSLKVSSLSFSPPSKQELKNDAHALDKIMKDDPPSQNSDQTGIDDEQLSSHDTFNPVAQSTPYHGHRSTPSTESASFSSSAGSSHSQGSWTNKFLQSHGTDKETLQAQAAQMSTKVRSGWAGFVSKRKGTSKATGAEAEETVEEERTPTNGNFFAPSNITKSLNANKVALADRLVKVTQKAVAGSTLTPFNLSDSLDQLNKRAHKDDPLGIKIRDAMRLIQDALDEYGEDHVAISFNGGKDCTVLIHLLAGCLYARHQANKRTSTDSDLSSNPNSQASLYPPIPAIYITAPLPFSKLETFVDSSARLYNLNLVRIGGGMKAALAEFLTSDVGTGVKAVLVGTRRGDPHGATLQARQSTDPSWPQFLRVHPILDWDYSDVWKFLRELHVPYCKLYDEGYTSLGSINNTHPNPYLLNPSSASGYDPAYKLEDGSLERCGRGDPVKEGPVRSQPSHSSGMMVPKIPARPNTVTAISSSSTEPKEKQSTTVTNTSSSPASTKSTPLPPPASGSFLPPRDTASPSKSVLKDDQPNNEKSESLHQVTSSTSSIESPDVPPRKSKSLRRSDNIKTDPIDQTSGMSGVDVHLSVPSPSSSNSRSASEVLKDVIAKDEEFHVA